MYIGLRVQGLRLQGLKGFRAQGLQGLGSEVEMFKGLEFK